MKRSAHTLKPHHCRKSDGYIFSITTVDRSDPLRSQNPQREERGGSDFLIITFSYNAGYTKHRGAKKPSFSGFRPFRRFLSLLGWLGRFFAFCTVVLFECIALYVWSAFCFTIVRLLVKLFLTLMSSSLPLDSGAAYLQQAFLYLCRPNCFCNTTMQSLHGV